MEDWTKKKPIFIKPNDWQTNLIIQEIQGKEAHERILRGEIEFHLREYEKDIRKQICDEIRANAISHNNLEVDMYYITPQQLYEIEQGEKNDR